MKVAVAKGGSAVKNTSHFTAEEVVLSFSFFSLPGRFFGDVPIVAELGHYGRIDSV